MIRIALVDDDAQVIANMKTLISTQNDLEIQGMGKDSYDAIVLVKKFKPDIVLLNASLGINDGIEIPCILKRYSPSTAIVILCSCIEDRIIQWMVMGVITSCLLRDWDMARLASILRLISQGESYLSPQVKTRAFQILAEHFREAASGKKTDFFPKKKAGFQSANPSELIWSGPLNNFSPAELRILHHIAKGYSCKEIVESLHIKEGTVRNYISRIMHKAGLKNRVQMVLYAQKHGLGRELQIPLPW